MITYLVSAIAESTTNGTLNINAATVATVIVIKIVESISPKTSTSLIIYFRIP